jgi:hypothetical protein
MHAGQESDRLPGRSSLPPELQRRASDLIQARNRLDQNNRRINIEPDQSYKLTWMQIRRRKFST